jgi:polyhydroxybutyrate depolymerase
MMNLRKGIFVLLSLSAAALLFSADAHAERMTWTIDGVQREAQVFRPAGAAAKLPVLFAFHGHMGTMRGASEALDFHHAWPRAIVVYMQGLPTPSGADPGGMRTGWQAELGQLGDRDLKFVDAVLATLHEKFSVDDSRIYAMGFSDGAFFTYLLWQERPRIFAAFAPCSGRIFPSVHLAVPKPAFIVAGENDDRISETYRDETIKTVRELDGATGKGLGCGEGCTLYASLKGTPVRVFIFHGGHEFPADTSAPIVVFFRSHALHN